jgi:integrase
LSAGARLFPLVAPVKRRLIAHKLATGRDGDDLVFGRTAVDRFVPSTVRRRARKAWKDAGLEPIRLHEGRHSAATAGSAAGLDDLALAYIMGHSSVVITRDRYGHVRPDRVAEVGAQLDAYYATAGVFKP